MHLHSLRIENFRALRHASLDLEPAATILVGENDVGKSSLLNALEACLGRGAPAGGFRFSAQDFHRPYPGSPPAGPIRIEIGIREETPASNEPAWPVLRRALGTGDGPLDFRLVVTARLQADGTPQASFWVLGAHDGPVGPHARALVEEGTPPDPAVGQALLAELRRVVPFIRVRAAVLPPAPRLEEPPGEHTARQQVEWEIRQAYAELLENPDGMSDRALGMAREALGQVLGELEDRVGPLPAVDVEERLAAPLSSSGSWTRLAGLLRGSGARSLAMLAFTGAFLQARGPDALEPDCRPVVSIEDPEAYLHPLMLTSVWSLIQRLPAQKIVTTNSSDLLSATPLGSLRRMVRSRDGKARLYRVPPGGMTPNDLRRIAYHLRVRRGNALFMRFWLLVEGETEFWLLPEAARALDIDLLQEGVDFLEFAQCGLEPLAALANHLGIGWHLLADGDAAGRHYAELARPMALAGRGAVTLLEERDVEHCFWDAGYEHVFREAAGLNPVGRRGPGSRDIIELAIKRQSKPRLALALGKAMGAPGSPGVPPALERMIRDSVRLARSGGAPAGRG